MLRVGGAVGVSRAAELLESQACFIGRRGSGVTDVFAEDWESLPKGKSLEGQDDLGITAVCDILDQGEVATQFLFFYKIIRCLQGGVKLKCKK